MIKRRGDIYMVDLGEGVGSEQCGIRPVLNTQNDIGNKYSTTITVASITSQMNKHNLPTHFDLSGYDCGLPKKSIVMMEQLRTIDESRIIEKIGHVDMTYIDAALAISQGLLTVWQWKNRQSVSYA